MRKTVCALLAAVMLLAASASAAAEKILTWNEVNGEEYGASVGAHAFAEKLKEVSGGEMEIDLYVGAALGTEQESMQGIQMGTLDIFRGNAASLPEYGAELIGTTGLPFLFGSMEEFHDFAESGLGRQVLDSVGAAGCGFRAIGWMVEGPRSLFITEDTWKKLGSPAQFSLEDLQGLVIRPGNDLIAETLRALGAETVQVPFAELNTSLEAGNLNGAENGITNYLDNGFYQTAPCFIPDTHLFGCGVILVSQSTWDGLSEQEREWMRTAARAGGEACYAYNLEHERDCEKRLKEMNLTLLEVADPEKWQEVCENLYGQQSPEIRELAEKIRRKEY